MPHPCERCETEIPRERLKAVPGTALCVKCSEAIGGEREYLAIEENLGKVGSLKKKYGGVGIYKRRMRMR